jgi:hypothetical protein
MVLGLFEDKNKQQDANAAEAEASEIPENPYAKKPDHLRAALNSAAKGAAIAGGAAILSFGALPVAASVAVGAAVMGGVGILEENNRVKYDEVTLQTDAKKESEVNNLNWLAGGTIGTAIAMTTPVGLVAIPAAVAAGWAIDNFTRENIQSDIEQKQAMLASDQNSAAYQAGVMDAANDGAWAQKVGGSRKRFGSATQQLAAQQEQELALAGGGRG